MVHIRLSRDAGCKTTEWVQRSRGLEMQKGGGTGIERGYSAREEWFYRKMHRLVTP